MKKRKFPQDVARFFNPQKSGTNAEYDKKTGILLRPGTHQYEKSKEKSYIPVYNAGGTAHVSYDKKGRKIYMKTFRAIQKTLVVVGIVYGIWVSDNMGSSFTDAVSGLVIVLLSTIIALNLVVSSPTYKKDC